MKLLLFVFMLVYLLYATEGLKCRECDDRFQYYGPDYSYGTALCDQTSNKTTWCSSNDNFCVTYTFDCNEYGGSTCYEKNCDYLRLCDSVGTHVPHRTSVITADCCQGDLCNDQEKEEILENVGTSVGLNKVSTHICLFYVLFPVVLAQLFV